MDTDLINKYIEKLNNAISELTKKNLVLEVQLELSNEHLAKKDSEIGELNSQLEAKDAEFRGAMFKARADKAATVESEVDEVRKELESELKTIMEQRAELQEECNFLRSQLQEAAPKPAKKKKTPSA